MAGRSRVLSPPGKASPAPAARKEDLGDAPDLQHGLTLGHRICFAANAVIAVALVDCTRPPSAAPGAIDAGR